MNLNLNRKHIKGSKRYKNNSIPKYYQSHKDPK